MIHEVDCPACGRPVTMALTEARRDAVVIEASAGELADIVVADDTDPGLPVVRYVRRDGTHTAHICTDTPTPEDP